MTTSGADGAEAGGNTAALPEDTLTIDGRPARKGNSRGHWLGITVIMVVVCEQVAFDYNLLSPVIPHIATHFHTAQVAWVISIFVVAGAVSTPVLGKLADVYGKRRMVLVGIQANIVGSALCLAAPGFALFLAGRAVQGVSLALPSLVYSLMRDIFPRRFLTLAVSITFSGVGLVGIAGPYVSGWLTDAHGYRGPFWFMLLMPVVCGALILAFVPETPLRIRVRIDWVGAVLLTAGVLGVLLGLGQGPAWGWTSAPVIGLATGGLVLLAGWGAYEYAGRDRHPLVDLRVITSRRVLTVMFAGTLGTTAIGGVATLVPIMVQMEQQPGYGFGSSALDVARFTILGGFTTMVSGVLFGLLSRRLGLRGPFVAGCVLLATGAALLASWHAQRWQVVAFVAIVGAGGGIVYAAIPNLVVASLPPTQQGVGAGMVALMQGLGAAAGTQFLFTVMALSVTVHAEGAPVYNDTSFIRGFTFCAGCALAAACIGLLHPRQRPPHEHRAAHAPDPASPDRTVLPTPRPVPAVHPLDPDRLRLLSTRVLGGDRIVDGHELSSGLYTRDAVLRTAGGRSLVLRRYPRDDLCAIEAALLRQVAERVPVPEVVHADAGPLLGEPFLLTTYSPGVPLSEAFATASQNDGKKLADTVGAVLAAVHSLRFGRPGLFSGQDLRPDAPPPEYDYDLVGFVGAALAQGNAGSVLSSAERRALLELAERWAPLVSAVADHDRLAHLDFTPTNIVVRLDERGTWRVSAVLRWEYARSGSGLFDVASMLRFPQELGPGFAERFPAAYEREGGAMPANWRETAEALDLGSLTALLNQSPCHPLFGKAAAAVRRKIADYY